MMSMRPKAVIAAATIWSNSDCSETSVVTAMAASPMSVATRSAPLAFKSATTTFAPSSARRFAMPSPNPDAAPVMMATLSFRRMPFYPWLNTMVFVALMS
jgi:hypothetical protein